MNRPMGGIGPLLAVLAVALGTTGDAGQSGPPLPTRDDPTVVQVEIAAAASEVHALIIEGMTARGDEIKERSEERLLFKGVTPERAGLAAVYGCRSCGDPYSAYLFLLFPASEARTWVVARHWVAVPQPGGDDRRFRPQKDRELKDIGEMLRDIDARRRTER